MKYYKIFNLESLVYSDLNNNARIEEWKNIVGYEGFYEVSDLGRVRGVLRKVSNNRIVHPKILKQRFNNRGYLVVTLRKNGGMLIPFVHKLVITSFLPNPENKPEGNHKFGIKWDNRLSQLEWVTKSENIKHTFEVLGRRIAGHWKGKFGASNPNSKVVICTNTGISYDSVSAASKELKLNSSSISAVCRGVFPSLFGLKFKYITT